MRIDRLDLLTNDLAAQRKFYASELPLPILEASGAVLSLQAGRSLLTFRQAPEDWNGFYHFAFNIPEDQFQEAKEWLSRRVMPIKDAKGKDEFPSKEWNAHSVYFYDPAGNILEFIARHTLDEHLERPFGERNILSISEIGLVSDDVPGTVRRLQSEMNINTYSGPGSDTFTAVGDEHGLFIVVKRGRIWFPDTGKPAVLAPLGVEITSDMEARYKLSGPPYE
ncbi:MAG: hypothetical protein ABIO92_01275, partial [Chloroflexia bacterium]